MKALDQILRGDVDDLDIVGSVDHQIRHGLAHADTGDLRDDIVEALDMLDIQGRIDVYAQRQEFQHIEIALRMTAAGRVGMGKLIDQNKVRAALDDGIEIHLLKRLPPVVDGLARQDIEPVNQRLGFAAAMGLHDTDHDIDTIRLSGACRHQHLIGLANAGGRAEEDFQLAAVLAIGALQEGLGRWTPILRRLHLVGH